MCVYMCVCMYVSRDVCVCVWRALKICTLSGFQVYHTALGVEEIVQMIKCSLHNHEDLNLTLRTDVKVWPWWRVLVILALGRQREADPGISSQQA